ncbi:hypothetical protein Tco_1378401 [Tanacetum coccineum]
MLTSKTYQQSLADASSETRPPMLERGSYIENKEKMYPTHTKVINSTIGDDQINSNIIFDEPNGNVNSGSVEKDTHVPDLYALEQLARNAYNEAEKQQLFAKKVQQQNMTLTSQLELYKERVRVLKNINEDNNYLNEFLEANQKAKHFNQQAQSQFVRDRDIIQDLEKQRDKLDLAVNDYKRKNEELQKTHLILKRQMSGNENRYHDTILHLEAKLKKNVDLILKLGNSLQGMFMLGPKPLSVYDPLSNSKIPLHVRDTEDTFDDASKSQQKMKEKMNDPIAVANKQNCWTIDYKQINALYKDFVPQKELSAEQTYFPSSFISSEEFSSETKPSMASMHSANPMLVDLNEMENVFKKLFELLEKNSKRASIFYASTEELKLIDVCVEAKLILQELHLYFEIFQNRFKRDVKEMKDVFVSVENDLDETLKQNELLKDRLLEASLAEDVKNLVITSCVEIRNKDLHDEIERISKESKDVSNESKTADTVYNDAFEVTHELSKRIVELEKDLSKFGTKSIAFEIAVQHKSRENNYLTTLQKENENFMASLQIENAHLKQTYKDLFESVQRSRVETNECDEVKVKVNFDEIETKNIELEHRVTSLIKENEHLKLTYQSLFDSIKKSRVQTKTSNVTQNETENLKSQLFEFAETKFNNILGKIKFYKKNQFDSFSRSNVDCHISKLKKELGENICDNAKCEFQTKFVELEKVLTQQTKYFDDVKLELSNRTTKFEAYFEKLEKMKVILERQLARKVDDFKAEKDQFLKKINHLRTQLENLKGKRVETKFDNSSILGKPPLLNNERGQLLKQIAFLESKLASQDIRSCKKEYHELRTSYNALKVKFDSLNRKKWNIIVSKS